MQSILQKERKLQEGLKREPARPDAQNACAGPCGRRAAACDASGGAARHTGAGCGCGLQARRAKRAGKKPHRGINLTFLRYYTNIETVRPAAAAGGFIEFYFLSIYRRKRIHKRKGDKVPPSVSGLNRWDVPPLFCMRFLHAKRAAAAI